MPVQTLDIESFLQKSRGHLLIDVRSPSEYRHAHIPHARSLPLFNDDERAVIGTAYKRQGREKAVKAGLEFFSSRMHSIQPQLIRLHKDATDESPPTFYVYCWRGGMRSGAVAWLLSLYGYKVFVLSGGYKSFRRWALSRFTATYHLKVLGGFTGAGKTQLLQQLRSEGHAVIDLEGLAVHRGSAFGSLGMDEQPSQEMFENALASELSQQVQSKTSIWLEDESRHIGRVHIPAPFWEQMRISPLYFMDVKTEQRLENIIRQYGSFEKEALIQAVKKIEKRLGGLDTRNAMQHIRDGNMKEAFSILLRYYDKQYAHSLKLHEERGATLHKIVCDDVDSMNTGLLL